MVPLLWLISTIENRGGSHSKTALLDLENRMEKSENSQTHCPEIAKFHFMPVASGLKQALSDKTISCVCCLRQDGGPDGFLCS